MTAFVHVATGLRLRAQRIALLVARSLLFKISANYSAVRRFAATTPSH